MDLRHLRTVLIVLVGAGAIVAALRYTSDLADTLKRSGPTGSTGASTIRLIGNSPVMNEFRLVDLDGRTISTADWRGKVTIVNFWATWCPPCRAEIPEFIALQARYRDELQIVGVSVDEGAPGTVRDFAKRYGINYPIVMVTPELRRAFPRVFALPTSFVLNGDGRVVQRHVGLVSIDVYEQAVRVLAGLAPDVVVEEINDQGRVLLANAAQATEIPGLDLSRLAAPDRRTAIERLNTDSCTCGCELTLAQCRINDPTCDVSLPLAQQVVDRIASGS